MDIVKILKKNTSILIPAAIAVLAILLFVPTVIIRGKISEKLEQSKRLGQNVDSRTDSAVSARQYEAVKTYEDAHQKDANDIHNLAIQTTQRELLSYKIFPEPNETSIEIFNEFKKAYNTAFAKFIKDMNALDAPTDIEIRKETGASTELTDSQSDRTSPDRNANKEGGKIVELICKRRSKEIPVYANPQVFSGYAFWNNREYRGTQDAVKDCWYCQLAYWIHKDIVDSINAINSGSTSIASSSVKRLLGIRFTNADAATVEAGSDTELPNYVTNNGDYLCQPWTGRKSNNQIDVVHFSVAVIARANDVLKFMDALCSEKQHYFTGYKGNEPPQQLKHNQITILQSNIEPVDRESQNHLRYRYGQDAIVQLNLICEYIFNKEGYDIIKPNSIKQEEPLVSGGTNVIQQQRTPSRGNESE
jgi:inorganic pyrophosphatase